MLCLCCLLRQVKSLAGLTDVYYMYVGKPVVTDQMLENVGKMLEDLRCKMITYKSFNDLIRILMLKLSERFK